VSPPPRSWQVAVAFAIVYIVWGTTYLAIKVGVSDQDLPPLLFGGTRIGTGGVILVLLQFVRGQSLRLSRRDAIGVGCGALFLFVGGNGLISVALRSIQSGESAVLAATTTLWMAVSSMAFADGDRLRPLGWLGLLMGLAGVAVLQWPSLQHHGFSFDEQIGPWFALASAGSWGIGTILLRHLRIRVPRLTSAGWQMTLGGFGMIAIGLALGESPRVSITPGVVGVFAYLLVFSSLFAFIAFHWLVEHVPAPVVGTYAYVNPLVAVVLGSMLRREPITPHLVGGMLMILTAVFLVRGGAKPTDAVTPADPAVAEPPALEESGE
jgi:drug/metabolite transporter (DMT)-like permease